LRKGACGCALTVATAFKSILGRVHGQLAQRSHLFSLHDALVLLLHGRLLLVLEILLGLLVGLALAEFFAHVVVDLLQPSSVQLELLHEENARTKTR